MGPSTEKCLMRRGSEPPSALHLGGLGESIRLRLLPPTVGFQRRSLSRIARAWSNPSRTGGRFVQSALTTLLSSPASFNPSNMN